MNPIKDIDDVFRNWDLFERGRHSLFSFFLYTDEDRVFARYIRENFESLDELSGPNCLIFLIDEPSRMWLETAKGRHYWSQFLFQQRIWEGFTASKPYEKARAYEIARSFGLDPRAMPCVAFFKDISDAELVVFRATRSWKEPQLTEFFRGIFAAVGRTGGQLNCEFPTLGDDERRRKREAHWNEMRALARIRNAEGLITQVLRKLKTVGDVLYRIRHQ